VTEALLGRAADALVERPNLRGGALCLDFANSFDTSPAIDYLGDYAGLLSWGRYVDAVSPAEADALRRAGIERPAEAEATWQHAVALRAVLTHIFSAVADGGECPESDLATLNDIVRDVLSHQRLAARADGFAWEWDAGSGALDLVLWPVVRSTVELLTGPELARVRRCGSRGCGWLFLDASKNQSRRWCGDVCSSREKARRYYRRRTGRQL
jgi:predicted RNA-binding Zn ribbon-like protein